MNYNNSLNIINEITHLKEGTLDAKISFNKEFPYFAGHFENQAIVPAFILINISKDFIERNLLKEKKYKIKIIKTKFLDIIEPNEVIELEAKHIIKDHYKITWIKKGQRIAIINIELG